MTTALRDAPMRVLRALACALGLSGMALACPPAPSPFVPFDGDPFRFRADLVDVAACSVAWFTLDESGIRSLDVDSSFGAWLLVEHESSFPLFLEPAQVVGPTVFDEIFGNRVTLDGRTFVVAVGFRFDRVYNEGIFMRLVFELPARPSAVVPPPPPARPEPTLVEIRRESWGAFEVVGESYDASAEERSYPALHQVRIIDASGEVRWESGDHIRLAFVVADIFGDGTPVLTVTGHTGGNPCCDAEYGFVQRGTELVMIDGFETWLRDYDDDGVPERATSVYLRVPAPVGYLYLPALQVWDTATTSFGPVVTRERFPSHLETQLGIARGDLIGALTAGDGVVRAAALVYALAYYQDPVYAPNERYRMRSMLPSDIAEELEAAYRDIEAVVDAFAAEAATWQPPGLGGD